MALHIGGLGSCGPSCEARRWRRRGRGALAEATRLVWQASSTAASVTVTTAFHGCSARRAAAGRAPAGRGHGVEPAVHHDRRRPRVATRIRSRSRGKTGASLPRQRSRASGLPSIPAPGASAGYGAAPGGAATFAVTANDIPAPSQQPRFNNGFRNQRLAQRRALMAFAVVGIGHVPRALASRRRREILGTTS